MKNNFFKIVLLFLVITVFISLSFAEVKNPDTIIYATIGGPESLDPHWAYDVASGEVIYQIYDNLINYNGESTTEFVPMLSTQVPSVENGLMKDDGFTYVFPIRKNVKFHNEDILTPEDVVYSIKRAIIFDRSGGPAWMLCEPLLGAYSIEDVVVETLGVENYSDLFVDGDPRGELQSEYEETMKKVFTDYVEKTIEIDGDNVVFHLAQAYGPFLNILAHCSNWASIIDKKWAIEQGAWDGKADTWWKYHDPENEKDPLYAVENGTGPFVLKTWIPEELVLLERFDDYWQGPAKIKNVQIKYINEYTTRKLMLQTGDVDMAYIPVQYISEVEKIAGVEVTKNLPTLANVVSMFPWTINAEGNSYIGSGKLDGEGIPLDFFSDIHVRKGFSYLFPYDIFISKVAKGMAIRNPGPIPKGVLGFTEDPALYYEFSLLKAKKEFQMAWGGALWEKGCQFNIFYVEGNDVQKAASDMLSTYAKILNPKFNLRPIGLQGAAFMDAFFSEKLPLFTIGWLADYPDPHNWAPVYMGSHGDYSSFFGEAYREFAKENVDPLLEQGLKETDKEKRAAIYKELTQIAHEQAISIYVYQPGLSHIQRTWIKGWYFNPIMPGEPEGADFYNLTKGE
jgi:peptide/nickel transport system substrate-binding protein